MSSRFYICLTEQFFKKDEMYFVTVNCIKEYISYLDKRPDS